MQTQPTSTNTVLITGGAGHLGQALIPLLLARGARVRAISRRGGTDGPGLTWVKSDVNEPPALGQALSGVDVVVHLATNAQKTGADLAMGRAVVASAQRSGVRHLVFMSIVSLERMTGAAYSREKLAVERLVEESGLPYTILRATQFHDLVALTIGMLTLGPLSLVPSGASLQPVDTGTVGQRLAELTLGQPAGRVQDLCGPDVLPFDQMAQSFHHARGTRKRVLSLPLPLPIFKAWRDGSALSGEGQVVGRSWQAWRDAAVPVPVPGGQRA